MKKLLFLLTLTSCASAPTVSSGIIFAGYNNPFSNDFKITANGQTIIAGHLSLFKKQTFVGEYKGSNYLAECKVIQAPLYSKATCVLSMDNKIVAKIKM